MGKAKLPYNGEPGAQKGIRHISSVPLYMDEFEVVYIFSWTNACLTAVQF